jgi:hypothetical protein
MDRDGIKPLLKRVREHFRRLCYLWLDAGYSKAGVKARTGLRVGAGNEGAGGRPAPEEAPLCVGLKEGEEIDYWERIRKLLPEPGFKVLCRGGG